MPYVGAGSQSVDRMTAAHSHMGDSGRERRTVGQRVQIQFMQIATAAAALSG